MNRSILLNLLKLTLALLLSQSAFARTPVDSESAYDKAISTKVKTALMGNKDITSISIEVHTKDGIVTLSGSVGSRFENYSAVRIARKVTGVKEVINNLEIKNYGNMESNENNEADNPRPNRRYYRNYNGNRNYYYRTNNGNYRYYRRYY